MQIKKPKGGKKGSSSKEVEVTSLDNFQEISLSDKLGIQRLLTNPKKVNQNIILNLQRKIGNQAVMRLLQKTNPPQIQHHPPASGAYHIHNEQEMMEQTSGSSQVARLFAAGTEHTNETSTTALSPLPVFEEPSPQLGLTKGSALQRLWDKGELAAKAGVPTAGASKYQAINKALDTYHTKAQKLWGKAKKSETFKKELNKVLDNLTKVTWAYVQNFDTATQVPFLRELVNTEIPLERKRIDTVINRDDFATNDRSKTLGEVKDGQPAKILDAGIQIGETTVPDTDEGGMAQSHSMDVWVEIDAGKEPIKPENAPPNTVYGVSLEYWENVDIAYNFVAGPQDDVNTLKNTGVGKVSKPWNDIMAMRPDAETFNKKKAPIDIAWGTAVNEAGNRIIRGVKKIGFTDNPGVTPLPGKYIERTLRFRIVLKDSTRHREIYATQKFKLDGQTEPVSKTYVDSVGNALGKTRDNVNPTVMNPMNATDPSLQSHGITPQILDKSVPSLARSKVKFFVKKLINGTAIKFDDTETQEIKDAFPTAQSITGPSQKYSRMANQKYNDPNNNFYEIAGMNLLPMPQPGQTYKQYKVNTGGLLVAIMQGPELWRMYYTDDQKRPVGAKGINVRSFAEIPVEEVTPYFIKERYNKSLTVNERAAFDAVKQAKAKEMVAENRQKNNITVAVNSDPTTIQYIIAHPEQYDLIEREFAKANLGRNLEDILLPYFRGEAHTNGAIATEYERLHALIPNSKAWKTLRSAFCAEIVASNGAASLGLAGLIVDGFYSTNRAAYGTVAALNPIITNNQGNKLNLENAIMNFIKTNRGKAPMVENDYNTAVTALTPTLTTPQNVPTTLGELANSFFTRQFKVRGKEADVFAQLMADYPDFQYRIKPTYRLLFGNDQLKHVSTQMRKAHAAADVIDPGSVANMRAKRAFRNHAPFTQANFTTSLNSAAKFDTEYNPATNQLKITVKLSFEFVDGNAPAQPVKGNEVGSQFTTNTWSPTAETNLKNDYKKSVLDIWNKETHPIRCEKPGWEDIVAVPVFNIQEVAKGNGHNHLKISKAALTLQDKKNKTGQKIADKKTGDYKKEKALKASGTSAWGSLETSMQEFDFANKISDPTVHKYLHQTEKTGNVIPAYNTDRSRLENRLNDFGNLEFVVGDRTNLLEPAKVKILAGELKRLGMPPDISRLHPIILQGCVNGNVNKSLCKTRAKTVEKLLRDEGINNPITTAIGPNNFDGVRVKAGPVDPKIADTYITKWQRITAAHEFGHMLGLMDEYYGAKSDVVVKKMISDGLLPPETRGDHFVAKPLTGNEAGTANEGPGQDATMKMLEANDLDTPDFTLKDNAKSTSLMTGGYELWSQHFISVWEALTKLTEADIDSKYWKIS